MNKITLILLVNLFLPSLGIAQQCGVLDFGSDIVWEYRNGAFFDIDGTKISSAVPDKKKVQLKIGSSFASIERLGNSRSKNSKLNLKISVRELKSKNIQNIQKGKSQIALLAPINNDLNILILNIKDATVFRASVANSLINKKIEFSQDENASFYIDDCSGNSGAIPN